MQYMVRGTDPWLVCAFSRVSTVRVGNDYFLMFGCHKFLTLVHIKFLFVVDFHIIILSASRACTHSPLCVFSLSF